MTIGSGPHLQDAYNIILICKSLRIAKFYNKVFIQHNSYNVIFISPVGVQNKDLVQKVPVGIIQNRVELITYAFLSFIIQIDNI